MARAKKASRAAYDFVKRREAEGGKPRLVAYQKRGTSDPVTVGFGHTGFIDIDGEYRKPRVGDRITDAYANMLFDEVDAVEAEARIDKYFGLAPLTQGQRDALFSFCYNLTLRSIMESTLRDLVNHKMVTRDIALEWFPKYRNPRTVFEEGLYRRRLAEACIFFECDIQVAEEEAWKAELRRDNNGEVVFKTDPSLVFFKAQKRSDEKIKIAREQAERKRVADQRREKAASEQKLRDEQRANRSRQAEEPADPASAPVEVAEAPAPVEATPRPPLPPLSKPPSVEPDRAQVTRPEFWSLNVLFFGRIALWLGLIPAAASDLILDPNFQAALGGAVAIYLGMWLRARSKRQAEKSRQRRAAQVDQAEVDRIALQTVFNERLDAAIVKMRAEL